MKHGQGTRAGQTRLYRTWANMLNRCRNPKLECWPNYGGRGIAYCSAWASFEQFAADMGPHPGPGWTLDRKDNDGNYEPGNCRWATRAEQVRNSRGCRLTGADVQEIRAVAAAGARSSVIAREFGLTHGYVNEILRGERWQ